MKYRTETNRKYVAYDIDKKYCELAEGRIKQFLREQTTLFNHQRAEYDK